VALEALYAATVAANQPGPERVKAGASERVKAGASERVEVAVDVRERRSSGVV
jgi:hypothetical protein